MRAIRFTVFGHEVWALEFDHGEEEAEEVSIGHDEVEKIIAQIQGKKVGGGSILDAERDRNPLVPGTEKDLDSWVDRPFGFHANHLWRPQ